MKKTITLLVCSFALAISCSTSALAQAPRANDVGSFFRFFCSRINLRPGDLTALMRALKNLRNTLPNLTNALDVVKLQVNPPGACLDGILNPGSLPQFPSNFNLASCFQGLDFKPQFTPPTVDSQCIARMMPSLGSLPTFDPNKLNNALNCLSNVVNVDLDLSSITGSLNNIIKAIGDLGKSLLSVLPNIERSIGSPAFTNAIKWTTGFCGKVKQGKVDLTALSRASTRAVRR